MKSTETKTEEPLPSPGQPEDKGGVTYIHPDLVADLLAEVQGDRMVISASDIFGPSWDGDAGGDALLAAIAALQANKINTSSAIAKSLLNQYFSIVVEAGYDPVLLRWPNLAGFR